MPLNSATVGLSITADHTKGLAEGLDLSTVRAPLDYVKAIQLATGTGINQADKIFHDQRTLAASANEDLDVAGGLTDVFGAAITFARIKALIVVASALNINNVIVGGAAANGFVSWVGAATDKVTVRPSGFLAVGATDATAYAVTAGTGDLLRIANSGAGSSVIYDIVLIGASA